ncbi:MAG TPA: hypothetical protein VF292_00825 [Rhodanobacteraceae bacterium]
MVDEPMAYAAQQGYRKANVSGLSAQATLERGLHAIVLYLVRAQTAAGRMPRDPDARPRALRSAASADRLLTFMARIADPATDLGRRLIKCYVGIQVLIAHALTALDSTADAAFGHAIVQARALEHSFAFMEVSPHG